jgi:hypothetical protein
MEKATEWLLANSGPIIRWRMLRDWGVGDASEGEALLAQVLATDEVRRWLSNLGGRSVHGSKDADAENAMAKLVEFGLRAGMPELDARMLPYAERMGPGRWDVVSDTVGPLLIAAGYAGHEKVRAWFLERLDALHRVAEQGTYEFYMSPDEAERVPKAWRGKRIYKLEYSMGPLRLPSCYDLYAMAHWPCDTDDERRRIGDVIGFISDPRFQETPGGYMWNTARNTCYAAGRDWLACLTEHRRALFLELVARFPQCHRLPWFERVVDGLERHRTERGTYVFPPDELKEKRDSYALYAGAHMGLGENRRRRAWLEVESTFRMLDIRRLMAG